MPTRSINWIVITVVGDLNFASSALTRICISRGISECDKLGTHTRYGGGETTTTTTVSNWNRRVLYISANQQNSSPANRSSINCNNNNNIGTSHVGQSAKFSGYIPTLKLHTYLTNYHVHGGDSLISWLANPTSVVVVVIAVAFGFFVTGVVVVVD